jgi:MtN3 and saliva related transmembrane protein
MDSTLYIGLAASIFTATSLLPQLIKMIKEKKANDISRLMLSILFIGLGLWVWYGVRKSDYIILVSNSFSLLINLSIVILSIRYKKK